VAKDDLHLVRVLRPGDQGKDVLAVKRMLSRAGVGFPAPVRQNGKFNDRFGPNFEAALKRFQKKNGLVDDGKIAYLTFKALVRHADAFGSKLLRDSASEQIGDWGIIGRRSAFNGLDMGVDFKGKGPIPMFAERADRTTRPLGLGLAGGRPPDRRPVRQGTDGAPPHLHRRGHRDPGLAQGRQAVAKGRTAGHGDRIEQGTGNRARLGRARARLLRHALSREARRLLDESQGHRRGIRFLEDALCLDGEGNVTRVAPARLRSSPH
jgi:peptidoglycan hydrolase-like protein with peptidoglycan-binding domain